MQKRVGLSGASLAPRALECIRILREELGSSVASIASGGTFNAAVAEHATAEGCLVSYIPV